MLHKLSIGTANFTQPYGVLAHGKKVPPGEVKAIFKDALSNGIHDFDTAFGYGDLQTHLNDLQCAKDMRLVSKFSVLDDYDKVYNLIQSMCLANRFRCFNAILIHDPQNIERVDKKKLTAFLNRLKKNELVLKVGVSVYDLDELKAFDAIFPTDLVQVPLNPLNQVFLRNEAQEYFAQSDIEVHARSLFLQGVLLANNLPSHLEDLKEYWDRFCALSVGFSSKLEALLSWANSQNFIDKWVLGVSSRQDLQDCIQTSCALGSDNFSHIFSDLTLSHSPFFDPRNWKSS